MADEPGAQALAQPSTRRGLSIRVRGIVQGVGFRPFVFGLAERHGLTGWVRNTSGQVEIEVDGEEEDLVRFLTELRQEAPPLARIDDVDAVERSPEFFRQFEILSSEAGAGWQAIPPDIATCESCLREVLDPTDRRYRYPFTNCTHCGPRFTIIEDLPYDRHRTTMRSFPMCEECRAEYEDPRNRRFHAQPVACPSCGPKVWLHVPGGSSPVGDPIEICAELLRRGRIVAIKGLGGYQLGCDAADPDAVSRLRSRKHRYGKPFALMVPDLAAAAVLCELSSVEAAALETPERPIVLARRRSAASIADAVAPGLDTLGLMLPYTPLHHLLLQSFAGPLVMTSGNLSEEPIAIGNWEALERLNGVADAFLLHDRDIYARYDDSVVRVLGGVPTPMRRARGYAPGPLELPFTAERDILACGGQQKNAFCLIKGGKAFLSQHIGDLENLETLEHFRDSLRTFRRLFRIEPEIIAHDLHPDYLSTRFAHEYPVETGLRVGVQHHHAHVVSAMAEHGLRDPVIGVAYDGTGYGTDGAIWGGELLVAEPRSFRRVAHLRYAPMLGGEAAIRRPYRMAAGYLLEFFGREDSRFEAALARSVAAGERAILRRQYETGLNAPMTSSCGRLFDAVAALIGLRTEALYEGQPAVELEAVADATVGSGYPYVISSGPTGWVIDPTPALERIWEEYRSGVPVARIAGRFHRTVSAFTAEACRRVRDEHGLNRVVMSGGCFQNALLTRLLVSELSEAGFEVFTHRRVPPNDGGLALGQAVVAHALTCEESMTQ